MVSLRERWNETARDRRRMESRLRLGGIVIGVFVAGTIVVRAIGSSGGSSATGHPSQALPLSTQEPAPQVVVTATAVTAAAQSTALPAAPAAATGVASPVATGVASPTAAAGAQQQATSQRTDARPTAQSTANASGATGIATPAGQVRTPILGATSAPSAAASPSLAGTSLATARPGITPQAASQLAATPVATSLPASGLTTLPPLATATPASGARTHIVRAGDTLLAIALRNNTTVDALVAANNLKTAETTLAIGQKLVLP
jgi:LysM repeat protein